MAGASARRHWRHFEKDQTKSDKMKRETEDIEFEVSGGWQNLCC
jgi:hypothetical protein